MISLTLLKWHYLAKVTRHVLAFLLVFLCFQSFTHAQIAKSSFQLDDLSYSIELIFGKEEYTITLEDKPDFYISRKISQLTFEDFRRVIIGEHTYRTKLSSGKEPANPPADTASVNRRTETIENLYAELVSKIHLGPDVGQRVGTLELYHEVTVKGINMPGISPIQNRGSQKESLQIRKGVKEKRKYIRQQHRNMDWLGDKISRIENRIRRRTNRRANNQKLFPAETNTDSNTQQNTTYLQKEPQGYALEKTVKPVVSAFTLAKRDTFKSVLKRHKAEMREAPNSVPMKIKSAQLVFEDGGMRQVMVEIEYLNNGKTELRRYSNKFSIGASTRQNFKDLGKIKLYQETNYQPSGYILFSDAMDAVREPGLRTNDNSPADQSFVLYPGETKELFKSPSSRLFSINLFSDVVGLDDANPNGLIQIEFSKRINLWTKRTDARVLEFMGVGWLTHMTPNFQLSKIENNNRVLVVNDVTKPLSPLNIYRHAFTRMTNEINIIDLQAPSTVVHSNFFIGGALTTTEDSASKEQERISTLMFGHNLKIILNPESKWHYEIGVRTLKLAARSKRFTIKETNSSSFFNNQWINTYEFLVSWKTSPDHKLFGRVRYSHDLGGQKSSFTQFQIGYSAFLKSSKIKTN